MNTIVGYIAFEWQDDMLRGYVYKEDNPDLVWPENAKGSLLLYLIGDTEADLTAALSRRLNKDISSVMRWRDLRVA